MDPIHICAYLKIDCDMARSGTRGYPRKAYHCEVETFSNIYEVRSTIISPGSWVSDFSGNSHAPKLNKAQTKRANITGEQHFLWI